MAANAADIRAGGAYVELSAKGESQVSGALKRVRSNLEKLSQSALAAGLKLGAIGAGMAYSMRKPIEAAANFEETLSKFKAVFKDQADEASKWAKTLADGIGRSETATMNYMASFQDIFVPMGFAREEATKLSKAVTQLGYDLASFGNKADEDVMQRILGGLIGNHENLRAFGVSIMESSLNAELMAMGLAKGTKQATEQQKVLARLRILLRGTSDAHGDAANTASSFTNTLKRLKAKFEEVQIAIGKTLNEYLKPWVEKIANFMEKLKTFIEKNPKWVQWFLKLTAAILSLSGALLGVSIISRIFSALLSPITLIIGAILYMAGAFDKIIDKLGKFKGIWEQVVALAKSVGNLLFSSLVAGLDWVMEKLMRFNAGLTRVITGMVGDLVDDILLSLPSRMKLTFGIDDKEIEARKQARHTTRQRNVFDTAADYFSKARKTEMINVGWQKDQVASRFSTLFGPMKQMFEGVKKAYASDPYDLSGINAGAGMGATVPAEGVTGFFGSTSGREMGGGGNSLGQRQLSVSQTMSWTLKSIDSKIGNMVASYA